MARKKKEKTPLFETVQFEDFEHAKRMVTLAKVNQIRILIGFVLAVIGTYHTAVCIFGNTDDPGTSLALAMIFSVPAYLIGGGIGKAIKTAWKIAKFGWFVLPVFPADLVFGIFFFFMGIFGLLFVPVIFVGLNYIQHKRTLDAAKSYLAQCGQAISAIEE